LIFKKRRKLLFTLILQNPTPTTIFNPVKQKRPFRDFFSSIRSRGGFTNNPTAIQFQSAYKKLLIHTELKSSAASNCLAQDDTSVLKISSATKK
jgi:hypothetical protein